MLTPQYLNSAYKPNHSFASHVSYRTLLPSQTATAADTGDRGSLQSTKDVCPHFDKFCALTDMLEFKLNDIANGLNRKKFADFTAAEMVKLVRALFEESPRRQTLLEAIEALPAK